MATLAQSQTQTMIFRAISSLMATRVSLTWTMTLPLSAVMSFAVLPTTNPKFYRCFFTSGFPPIFWMVSSSPTLAKVKGIIRIPPVFAGKC